MGGAGKGSGQGSGQGFGAGRGREGLQGRGSNCCTAAAEAAAAAPPPSCHSTSHHCTRLNARLATTSQVMGPYPCRMFQLRPVACLLQHAAAGGRREVRASGDCVGVRCARPAALALLRQPAAAWPTTGCPAPPIPTHPACGLSPTIQNRTAPVRQVQKVENRAKSVQQHVLYRRGMSGKGEGGSPSKCTRLPAPTLHSQMQTYAPTHPPASTACRCSSSAPTPYIPRPRRTAAPR